MSFIACSTSAPSPNNKELEECIREKDAIAANLDLYREKTTLLQASFDSEECNSFRRMLQTSYNKQTGTAEDPDYRYTSIVLGDRCFIVDDKVQLSYEVNPSNFVQALKISPSGEIGIKPTNF